MSSTHPRPRHASYLAHRKQVAWQIILPIVLAGLLLIGLIYLVWWGTFQASGDVSRWAAISTMWLTIPVMIGGLIGLAVLLGVAYALGRLAGIIPRYSHPAQTFAWRVAEEARKIDRIGHRPLLLFPEIGRLIRKAVQRIRRGRH